MALPANRCRTRPENREAGQEALTWVEGGLRGLGFAHMARHVYSRTSTRTMHLSMPCRAATDRLITISYISVNPSV